MARDWRLERAVLYTLSPLSRNLGLGALITALARGGELVLHDLARGASLLDRLEETGAEFLFGVPRGGAGTRAGPAKIWVVFEHQRAI